MLGWEFPPFISGGLGTACQGLTRALARLDMEILFVLPTALGAEAGALPAAWPAEGSAISRQPHGAITFKAVPSAITSPYVCAGGAARRPALGGPCQGGPAQAAGTGAAGLLLGGPALRVVGTGAAGGYEGDLIGRIEEYAARCLQITQGESFDVIHAHDWVTYPAGLAIAARSGRPLVVHVHSTEFDRSGEHVNQPIYDIERRGMLQASRVITVSRRTRRLIVERYGVPAEKVQVVYNGIDPQAAPCVPRNGNGTKTVLFLGRITMQKGPEYFVRAAARVLSKRNHVRFIMAGWGDLGPQTVEQVAAMGLGANVHFAGFLRHDKVQQAFDAADVFVMPSVSEPFGLAALEAVQRGVPVVLSKTSGAAEVLRRGALLVDFWDVDQMASKILALLERPELSATVCREGAAELRRLTWDEAARRCAEVYAEQVASAEN
jgi:glycosyltransferase involved in cell wall biosynthesis